MQCTSVFEVQMFLKLKLEFYLSFKLYSYIISRGISPPSSAVHTLIFENNHILGGVLC